MVLSENRGNPDKQQAVRHKLSVSMRADKGKSRNLEWLNAAVWQHIGGKATWSDLLMDGSYLVDVIWPVCGWPQDLKAISGFWPFKSGAPAFPLRSAEGAPYGSLLLSGLAAVSRSALNLQGRGSSQSCPIKKASRGGRWPDDTAAELGGPASFTGTGSFLFSEADGGERRHGRAAASVLAQVRSLLYQLSKLWRPDLFALPSLHHSVPAALHFTIPWLGALEDEKCPGPGAHAGVTERRSRRCKMVGDDKARVAGRQRVCGRSVLHPLLSLFFSF